MIEVDHKELAEVFLATTDADFLFSEGNHLWDSFVADLSKEFDAALADRWGEWLKARKAGLPLGEFVTED